MNRHLRSLANTTSQSRHIHMALRRHAKSTTNAGNEMAEQAHYSEDFPGSGYKDLRSHEQPMSTTQPPFTSISTSDQSVPQQEDKNTLVQDATKNGRNEAGEYGVNSGAKQQEARKIGTFYSEPGMSETGKQEGYERDGLPRIGREYRACDRAQTRASPSSVGFEQPSDALRKPSTISHPARQKHAKVQPAKSPLGEKKRGYHTVRDGKKVLSHYEDIKLYRRPTDAWLKPVELDTQEDANTNAKGGEQKQPVQIEQKQSEQPPQKVLSHYEDIKLHRRPTDAWLKLHPGKIQPTTKYSQPTKREYHTVRDGKKVLSHYEDIIKHGYPTDAWLKPMEDGGEEDVQEGEQKEGEMKEGKVLSHCEDTIFHGHSTDTWLKSYPPGHHSQLGQQQRDFHTEAASPYTWPHPLRPSKFRAPENQESNESSGEVEEVEIEGQKRYVRDVNLLSFHDKLCTFPDQAVNMRALKLQFEEAKRKTSNASPKTETGEEETKLKAMEGEPPRRMVEIGWGPGQLFDFDYCLPNFHYPQSGEVNGHQLMSGRHLGGPAVTADGAETKKKEKGQGENTSLSALWPHGPAFASTWRLPDFLNRNPAVLSESISNQEIVRKRGGEETGTTGSRAGHASVGDVGLRLNREEWLDAEEWLKDWVEACEREFWELEGYAVVDVDFGSKPQDKTSAPWLGLSGRGWGFWF